MGEHNIDELTKYLEAGDASKLCPLLATEESLRNYSFGNEGNSRSSQIKLPVPWRKIDDVIPSDSEPFDQKRCMRRSAQKNNQQVDVKDCTCQCKNVIYKKSDGSSQAKGMFQPLTPQAGVDPCSDVKSAPTLLQTADNTICTCPKVPLPFINPKPVESVYTKCECNLIQREKAPTKLQCFREQRNTTMSEMLGRCSGSKEEAQSMESSIGGSYASDGCKKSVPKVCASSASRDGSSSELRCPCCKTIIPKDMLKKSDHGLTREKDELKKPKQHRKRRRKREKRSRIKKTGTKEEFKEVKKNCGCIKLICKDCVRTKDSTCENIEFACKECTWVTCDSCQEKEKKVKKPCQRRMPQRELHGKKIKDEITFFHDLENGDDISLTESPPLSIDRVSDVEGLWEKNGSQSSIKINGKNGKAKKSKNAEGSPKPVKAAINAETRYAQKLFDLKEKKSEDDDIEKAPTKYEIERYLKGAENETMERINSIIDKELDQCKASMNLAFVHGMYPGFGHAGHKTCVLPPIKVPAGMGWLWNNAEGAGVTKPKLGWKPGAIRRDVAQLFLRVKRERIEMEGMEKEFMDSYCNAGGMFSDECRARANRKGEKEEFVDEDVEEEEELEDNVDTGESTKDGESGSEYDSNVARARSKKAAKGRRRKGGSNKLVTIEDISEVESVPGPQSKPDKVRTREGLVVKTEPTSSIEDYELDQWPTCPKEEPTLTLRKSGGRYVVSLHPPKEGRKVKDKADGGDVMFTFDRKALESETPDSCDDDTSTVTDDSMVLKYTSALNMQKFLKPMRVIIDNRPVSAKSLQSESSEATETGDSTSQSGDSGSGASWSQSETEDSDSEVTGSSSAQSITSSYSM